VHVLWTVAGLLFIVVVVFRLATRRGRRQVWWVCGTLGPATGIVSGVLYGNTVAVDTFLGTPNAAVLLATLTSATGGCCLFIFWHVVRNEAPSKVTVSVHLGVAVLLGVILTSIWAAAPVYDRAYADPRDIPFTDPAHLTTSLLFHVYFAAPQAVTAICACQALQRPPGHDLGFKEPALRAALIIVVPASAAAFLGTVAWVVAELSYSADGSAAFRVGDLLILVAMVGYTVTCGTVLAGPRLHHYFHSQQLVRRLSTLWSRIRDLYPAVVLPAGQTPKRPSLRAQRMLIEIGDGLNLLPVPARADEEPVQAVARALADPTQNGGQPAAAILPTAGTRREEEALFLSIAQAYDAQQADHAAAS
jgi:hypothetical protein